MKVGVSSMRKAIVCLFLGVLFLPAMLAVGTKVSGKELDVPLSGYTDSTQKPEFSLKSFWDGQFQSSYTAWYQENFQPRGVFIRNYNTIRYNIFQLDNQRIIGKNHDIFGLGYINAELCIGGSSDFSQPEAQRAAQEYVSKLEQLKEELDKYGKALYVVLTPSKADFHRENIPDKYVALSDPDAVPGQDYLAQLLEETDIPHIVCADYKDDLTYPAFYHSGIHWSRTFEQETFARLINGLGEYMGEPFPRIHLGEVAAQDTPFWRDADVFKLTNTWNPYTETYYQYDVSTDYPDGYSSLGILFQGTSFSIGLFNDFSSLMPEGTAIYINRNDYINTGDGNVAFESFEELDLSGYLDQVDAVVIEVLPAELENYSHGFVEAMLATLETYAPAAYMENLDVTSSEAWDTAYLTGLHSRETNHVWTEKTCEVTIEDPAVKETGLEISYAVPSQFFKVTDAANVKIYVNGVMVEDLDYQESWRGSVLLTPEQLAFVEGDVYSVRLSCDTSFIPAETDGTADTRELSLHLYYIGRKR